MNLIQTLEQRSLSELEKLATTYPYAAVIQMVYAKKIQKEEGSLPESVLARTSFRSPNRVVLKDYLELVESQSTEKEQINERASQPSNKIDQEKDVASTDELEEEQNQVSHSKEDSGQTEDHTSDEIESNKEEESQQEVELQADEKVSPTPVFHGFDDDHVEPIGKDLVDAGEDENSILDEDNQHLEGNNMQKVNPEDELAHDDYKIRLNMYHADEDDTIEEIGNELVVDSPSDKKETPSEEDYKTVADIQKEDKDAVYKKLVDLLKVEDDESQSVKKQSHIVESREQEQNSQQIQHDTDSLTEELDKPTEQPTEKEEESEESRQADKELEELYAKAAYEAELAQQSRQQKEDSENSNDVDSSEEEKPIEREQQQRDEEKATSASNTDSTKDDQPKDFLSWLEKFSNTDSTNQAHHHKQNNKSQQASNPSSSSANHKKEDIISQEVANQYRDAEEDLDDETTREVQKLAQKSMTKDESFYTETMAYVYEKQEKWDKAIEVYEQLALKNPEKSTYFADQIQKLKEKR